MSQIETRRNIASIDSISLLFGATAAVALTIHSVIKNINLEKKSISILENKLNCELNNSNLKTIESPSNIAAVFNTIYSENIKTSKTEDLKIQKENIISRIVEQPLIISQPDKIKENILDLYESDLSNIQKNVKKLFVEIEKQHSTVFRRELSEIVLKASVDSGFSNVEIKKIDLKPVIVALDKEGRGIVSEIKIDDKTKQIDIISETVGITDGTCTTIMKKFDDSLKKYGVKFSEIDKKFTGGSCNNDSTKKVDSEIKEKKEKTKVLKKLRNANLNYKIKRQK